jgi:hypothetical protein
MTLTAARLIAALALQGKQIKNASSNFLPQLLGDDTNAQSMHGYQSARAPSPAGAAAASGFASTSADLSPAKTRTVQIRLSQGHDSAAAHAPNFSAAGVILTANGTLPLTSPDSMSSIARQLPCLTICHHLLQTSPCHHSGAARQSNEQVLAVRVDWCASIRAEQHSSAAAGATPAPFIPNERPMMTGRLQAHQVWTFLRHFFLASGCSLTLPLLHLVRSAGAHHACAQHAQHHYTSGVVPGCGCCHNGPASCTAQATRHSWHPCCQCSSYSHPSTWGWLVPKLASLA